MAKKKKEKRTRKNKTIFGVIGVLLILFGMIGTIPVLQQKSYVILIITAMFVSIGVILVAWSFSD